MRIFHVATASDWREAQQSGRYTTSTRGRTLAEEGFIHASRADQWQRVRTRFYADVEEPLVLLVIDPDLLSAPVVEEPVADSPETFPHVYGAIDVAAVVQALPLDATPPAAASRPAPVDPPPSAPVAGTPPEPSPSFSRLFLAEVLHNVLLATIVLVVVVCATLVGVATDSDWGPLTGAALGLVVGVLVARTVHARRA